MIVDSIDRQRVNIAAGRTQHDQRALLILHLAWQAEHIGQRHFGYTATTVIYSTLGLAATFATAWRWRGALWSASAPANVHP